jgi:hypothetical protein
MYSPAGVDNTQALADAHTTARLVANLRRRVRGSVAEMRTVFGSLDQVGGWLGWAGLGRGWVGFEGFLCSCIIGVSDIGRSQKNSLKQTQLGQRRRPAAPQV